MFLIAPPHFVAAGESAFVFIDKVNQISAVFSSFSFQK